MPQNITDVDEFTEPCTAPADGDTRNATSVLTPLQKLANRTRYLYNILTAGVRRIRYFADIADLRDLTGMAAGDVVVVNDTYLGLYVYDTGVSGAEVYPWFIKPTGVLDGTSGRWRHIFNTFGVNNATLGSNKWVFNGPGRIVEAPSGLVTSPSSNSYGSAASWQDTGVFITKTLVTGDLICLTGTTVWSVDSAEDISFRIRVEAPGGNSVLDGSEHEVSPIGTSKKNHFSTSGVWTAVEDGSHTFKLQVYADAGVPFNVTLYAQRSLQGMWVRP